MEDKEMLTTKEACEYTNRSIETIRRWMREQPEIRKQWDSRNRHWLLNKADLDAKLQSLAKE